MVENTTKQALSEVYVIINHFDRSLFEKIPNNFMNFVKNNRDINYHVNIDFTKTINEQKLLKETRVILSLIYRDYICSEEERKAIILNDRNELEKQEETLRKKYEINFNKSKTPINNENNDKKNELVQIKQQTWIKKLISRILKIFKRKTKNKKI